MAKGIAIGDVTNKLEDITDEAVIPVSSGENVPQVVETGALKEYINEEPNVAINILEGRVDSIQTLTNSEIENLLN